MEKEKGKRLLKKTAVIVAAVAVFTTLFIIPFRVEHFEDEDIYRSLIILPDIAEHSKDVIAYSPVVPWYKIREDHYIVRGSSNHAFIEEVEMPVKYMQRRLVVFGKSLWYTKYMVFENGKVIRDY